MTGLDDLTKTTATQEQPKAGVLASESFDFKGKAGEMQAASTWKPSDSAMVSTQLDKLLKSDSPYIQQAKAGAMRQAARRGLLNSSMAAGAGESAAIQSALPIAQQDAGTWARSEEVNTGAQNQFARDANQFGRDSSFEQYRGLLAREAQGADQTFRAGQSDLDRQQQTRIQQLQEQGLDRRQASDISYREREAQAGRDFTRGEREATQEWTADENDNNRKFQERMHELQVTANTRSSVTGFLQNEMARIAADGNLTPEQKAAAIKNAYAYADGILGWASVFGGNQGQTPAPPVTVALPPPSPPPVGIAAPSPVVGPVNPAPAPVTVQQLNAAGPAGISGFGQTFAYGARGSGTNAFVARGVARR